MSKNHKPFFPLAATIISLSLAPLISSCRALGEFVSKSAQFPSPIEVQVPLTKKELYQIPEDWSAIEQAILDEHNKVRQNPQSYIPLMEAWLDRFTSEFVVKQGVSSRVDLKTQEGKRAVIEAIEFLRKQPSLGPINPSIGLAKSAADHSRDQGKTGETGHDGSDGSDPGTRMKRYGVPFLGGENIAYGPNTAQQVVMQLIIDDGVPDRGHRTNIFKPEFQVAGVSCGEHTTFRTICVINYAQGYLEGEDAEVPDVVFKVSNRSGREITGIYLSPADDSDWGDNWLKEPLGHQYIGTYKTSGFIRGNNLVCDFNILAIRADGLEDVAREVNLCQGVYTLKVN